MENMLMLGDSLDFLKKWDGEGKENFIDLVYNDPPFNSNRNYNILFDPMTDTIEEAFKDTWSTVKYIDLLEDFKDEDIVFYNFLKNLYIPSESLSSYIIIMGITYWYIHKMMKSTATLYHHCDVTTSHYMKIVLDFIFGYNNYINEIKWTRTRNTGSSKSIAKRFPKNHDVIFIYSKTNNYIFNQQIRPFGDDEIKWRFPHDEYDGKGPYHWNTLASYSQKRLEDLRNKGELKISQNPKVKHKYSYKVYHKQHKGGIVISDLWNDIKPVHGMSDEFKGYPTQKPESLLKRIISSSTNEGDLVVDFFNGGGTTVTTAVKMKRKFIGIDINYRAIQITKERLESLKLTAKQDYYIMGIPRSSVELRDLVDKNIYGKQKNSKFALEEIAIKWYLKGVIGNKSQVADGSIDGRFSFEYNEKQLIGIVQITSTASINHFKAFCSEVSKGTGDLGVYVTFEDTVTKGIRKEAKQYGRLGNVDKIQILTFEELIDNDKQFQIPQKVLTM